MNISKDAGKILGIFGWAKFRFIGCIVCAVIFIGVAILCFSLINIPTSREAAHGGAYFDITGWPVSPFILFMSVGGGLLILAAITLLVARSVKAKYTFTVYEGGIASRCGGKETYIPFRDIEDVYLFSVGRGNYSGELNSLAYRKSRQNDWIIISLLNTDSEKLISLFRQLHAEQRSRVLQDKIEQCHKVKFDYVSAKNVWLKRAFTLRIADYLKIDASLKPLYLTKEGIVADEKNIVINKTDCITNDSWVENLYVLDSHGSKKFSMMFPTIISGDAFITTLNKVIETKD